MPDTQLSERTPRADLSQIQGVLSRLRQAIRRYVLWQGAAWSIVWLGLAFWASLAIDWLFEPPVAVRVAVLAIAALGLALVVYRDVLRRWLAPLADSSLALLLERRFPALGGALATAVELAPRAAASGELGRHLLVHSTAQAAERTRSLRLLEVFDRRPLGRALALALVSIASVAWFAWASTAALEVWFARNVRLSNVLWPRKTALLVEGFQDGRVRIARGSDFELAVRADLAKELPRVVQVRYRTEEGARGRENLSQVGTAVRGVDAFQRYAHTFKGVLVSIELDVQGGDDRIRGLRIEVVDSPTAAMTVDAQFPPYTGRAAVQGIPASSLMSFPQGTRLKVHGRANKPLARVEIARAAAEAPTANAPPGPPATVAGQEFEVALAPLDQDETLLITLLDADGVRNRQPLRLSFAAVPDEAPQVLAQLSGIGSAITAQARVPVTGQVSDDYGLSRAWFEYQVGETPAGERPLALAADGRLDGNAFSVAELQLGPGQHLLLGVKAADNRALEGGVNVGTGQRYLLEVVSPEELRAMLEARELVLRRRLETIVEEFTETRDSLDRVELTTAPPKAAARGRGLSTWAFVGQTPGEAPERPASDSRAAETPPANEPPPRGSPGAPAGSEGTEADERLRRVQLNELRVQRALQNGQRAAHEVSALASSFDDIRAELVNNGLDSETLRARLQQGIADPLRAIATEQFSQFEARLEELSRRLEDPAAGPSALLAARQQADVILLQMKQVLDKMIEMESFTEVLDMLRSIITSQEALHRQTQARREEKTRELLGDE